MRAAIEPSSRVWPVEAAPPMPLLARVDARSGAVVQAARRAGLHPQVTDGAAATACRAEGCLVVVMADALDMAPGRALETLRARRPLRVVLVGPGFGSLAHSLALDLGFDEAWPADLPAPMLEAMLARAWRDALSTRRPTGLAAVASLASTVTAAVPSLPPPGRVDLSTGLLHLGGHARALPRDCLCLLDGLLRAYPAPADRQTLAALVGHEPSAAVHGSRRVDMLVCRLRRELQRAGDDTTAVHAVRGVGYRLVLNAVAVAVAVAAAGADHAHTATADPEPAAA